MYSTLPFGPFTLPTGPFLALIAVYVGLDAAARFGRSLRLPINDTWNTGLLALAAGLVVARLWNVLQFWYVYAAEPWLIVNPRPSGLAFWPGVAGALVAGYAYLLRRAVSPVKMAAALSVGWLVSSAILSIGAYLTGSTLGLPSRLPWSLPYYGELQHPAALYLCVGFAAAAAVVWWLADRKRPGRTVLLAWLGYGLVELIAGGFTANVDLIGPLRARQVIGLAVALLCSAGLAYEDRRYRQRAGAVPQPAEHTAAEADAAPQSHPDLPPAA